MVRRSALFLLPGLAALAGLAFAQPPSPDPSAATPPAATEAPVAGPANALRPLPANVAAKLARLSAPGGGALRPDRPAEAANFFRDKRAPRLADGSLAPLPADRYLDALRAMEVMPQRSTRLDVALPTRGELAERGISYVAAAGQLGAWEELGPGNVGGRTRGLVIDPTNARVMYAAGVAGGVWKTTNGGASWTPLADLLPNIAVASLALDPADPRTLYAGTGEGFFNGDAVRGLGIFKSTDAGATWTRLAATANANFHFVNDLVVSKANRLRIYAATSTGVWRSLDGGATFKQVVAPDVPGGCLDLAIRTDLPSDTVFAACGNFVQGRVWRHLAAEGSGAWTNVFADPGMGRTSLAIAPSNQNIVFALAASNQPGTFQDGLHGVFRSTAGGAAGSWTAQLRNTSTNKLSTLLLSNPVYGSLVACGFGTNDQFFNQGWYDNVIAVDPKDPNRVWVGGIDLFRSDDAGKTFGLASYWWVDEASFAHADQHAIVFHPGYNGTNNKTLFVGNDGGLFKTVNARAAVAKGNTAACDPTKTPFVWTALNNGYGVTQFYHGVPYPDGGTWFGGTQDNGTIRGNELDGPDAWTSILGGDGGYVAVAPNDTNRIYAEFTGLSLRRSLDGGGEFADATAGIDASEAFLFIAPFTMDPGNSNRLWIGGNSLWRTTNGATSWSKASRVVAGSGVVSAIAVAPTDGRRVLAGTGLGHIHRNTNALASNGGTAWPVTRPRVGFVSSVTFDPTNPQIAYATYSDFGGVHVWRSTNGGQTFTARDGSGAGKLPDVPVHVLAVDPANPARLFIGTDVGVFSSTNSGASWAVENTGFANVITEALAIDVDGSSRTLYAFTHGRGAWRVALP